MVQSIIQSLLWSSKVLGINSSASLLDNYKRISLFMNTSIQLSFTDLSIFLFSLLPTLIYHLLFKSSFDNGDCVAMQAEHDDPVIISASRIGQWVLCKLKYSVCCSMHLWDMFLYIFLMFRSKAGIILVLNINVHHYGPIRFRWQSTSPWRVQKKKTINKSRQFKVALVMECWNVWNLTYDMKAAEPVLQEI